MERKEGKAVYLCPEDCRPSGGWQGEELVLGPGRREASTARALAYGEAKEMASSFSGCCSLTSCDKKDSDRGMGKRIPANWA